MHQRMIAKDYLLHNSGWVYRPIWTYEAENRGARVIFYFYSTNCDEFKTVNGYVTTTAGWQLASWPHVLVWNQYQKRFVNRSFYSSERVDVVGPIWFSSSDKLELLPRSNYNSKKAAIFDVQPHRSSRYQTLGLITEYYDSSVAIQFLKDIDSVLIEFNIVALYKRKRDIGDILHPKYKYTLKRLQRNNSFNIDPNLSAYDLISESDLVISMPFTSTAILARDQKKSSIYYDPFGYVARDDRAAHGIPIIIGIDELRLWIYRALN